MASGPKGPLAWAGVMKRSQLSEWFSLQSIFLILVFSAAPLVSGCAGSGKGTYPTLKQTRMNVDWPMTRYRNGVAAGVVTLGERERVDAAYKNYKQAFDAAVQDAHSNLDVTTPENVKVLANQVIEAISSIPF